MANPNIEPARENNLVTDFFCWKCKGKYSLADLQRSKLCPKCGMRLIVKVEADIGIPTRAQRSKKLHHRLRPVVSVGHLGTDTWLESMERAKRRERKQNEKRRLRKRRSVHTS